MTSQFVDYIEDSDLSSNFISGYLEQEIETKFINGNIYRADAYLPSGVQSRPKFYGSMNSAIVYMHDDMYLIIYKTKKPLRILNLTSSDKNINALEHLFLVYLPKEYPHLALDIKFAFIFLQISFGLIRQNMTQLNLCGLSIDEILNYASTQKIDQKSIYLLKQIMTIHIHDSTIIPSRTSTKSIDQMLMKKMATICSVLKIDGCCYIKNASYTERSACTILSQYFDGSLCVPTELCIFNPSENLNVYKILKNKNKKYFYLPTKLINKNIKKGGFFDKKISDDYQNMYKSTKYKTKMKNILQIIDGVQIN